MAKSKLTGRARAVEILESMRNDWNFSDHEMLDYIIVNWMSGDQAASAMEDLAQEMDIKV